MVGSQIMAQGGFVAVFGDFLALFATVRRGTISKYSNEKDRKPKEEKKVAEEAFFAKGQKKFPSFSLYRYRKCPRANLDEWGQVEQKASLLIKVGWKEAFLLTFQWDNLDDLGSLETH